MLRVIKSSMLCFGYQTSCTGLEDSAYMRFVQCVEIIDAYHVSAEHTAGPVMTVVFTFFYAFTRRTHNLPSQSSSTFVLDGEYL
jgi:hypothetical protein